MPLQPIEIDGDLVDRVMPRHGLQSPSAAVDYALGQLAAEPLTREQALATRGSGWAVRPGAARHAVPSAPLPPAPPPAASAIPVTLIDGTAWIEYLRATASPADRRVGELLVGDTPLATTDLVLMKVLAGAADDAHRDRLRALLARCRYLPMDAPRDFVAAADLHRRCRDAGIRVGHLPECLTAVVAIRQSATVLHASDDFDAIARCAPLRIDTAGSMPSDAG
jgi:hypothetical protein